MRDVDAIIAPIGEGGLARGPICGLAQASRAAPVYGAEPIVANDGARSLRVRRLVANDSEPKTIADGVRALSLGVRNWEILRDRLSGIFKVTERQIVSALRLLFEVGHLKAEPAAAVSVAALLAEPLHGESVCCIFTGANVDTAAYARLLTTV